VTPERTDVSEDRIASIIRVKSVSELDTSIFSGIVSSGMLRRVALVRTDVSEEPSASIKVTRIRELGTTLTATSTHASNISS
jgi:hypothetical protein